MAEETGIEIIEDVTAEIDPVVTKTFTPDLLFERDMDSHRSSAHSTGYNMYSEQAVMRYRAESVDAIIKDTKILMSMINHHMRYQVPRLKVLEDYYTGRNFGVQNRKARNDANKSDHRVAHGFATTISDFLNSHVLGNPVKIEDMSESESGNDEWMSIVRSFNETNDINSHNVELGKDQNNMGRAYELLQRNANDEDRLYMLDPKQVFMIYDMTVRTRVIGAVRYYKTIGFDDTSSKYNIELYTHDKIYRFDETELDVNTKLELNEENIEEHFYNGVPIIEYRSDRYRMGIYERELSLIDAYDSAQSDTANYMTDFNDAILLITGKLSGIEDPETFQKMINANILVLNGDNVMDSNTGTATAQYLTKSYDVAGVEAYKTRLRTDIFNLANIPDLTDSAFAGNSSGEALKYKMFGLQQRRIDKEKYLVKGLRIRYKLLENIKRATSEYSGEEAKIDFTFTPNLPKAYIDELKAFVDAGGDVSLETKLGLLSFIDNPSDEVALMKSEREDSIISLSTMSDDYTTEGMSDES